MIVLVYLFSLVLCNIFLKQVVELDVVYQMLISTTLRKGDPADFDKIC